MWFRLKELREPEWLIALLITLAAMWFHLSFHAHAGGLWRDEANTVSVASRHSPGEMANDSFPILMPVMVRGWEALGLGGSDRGLRWLGTLIGLGLLAALWVAAWIGKSRPPALGLALFGLNSTAIIYGDSLRAFGVGSLLDVLLLAAMCAFLRKSSWSRTALLAASAILSVQALFQNAIFVAAVCAGGWVVCWWRRMLPGAAKILLVAVLAAASLLPYGSRIEPLARSSPTSGISTLRTEFRPAVAFGSLGSALGFPLRGYVWIWGLSSLAVLASAARAWRGEASVSRSGADGIEGRHARVLAATTLLAGVGLFAVFLWWAALRTQPWHFLPLMALAAACFELSTPPLRHYFYAVFLAFVVVTALLALPYCWRGVNWRFTNADLIARRLAADAAPQDFVLVTPWNRGISFERYFHGKASWETVPPLEDHSVHRYDLLQKQTQTSHVMRPVFERNEAALQAGQRVWVVGTMDVPAPGAGVPGDLGPPPREHTGWSAGPYVRRWTAQAAQFLVNHSNKFVEVPLHETKTINPNETLGLWEAEGWKAP